MYTSGAQLRSAKLLWSQIDLHSPWAVMASVPAPHGSDEVLPKHLLGALEHQQVPQISPLPRTLSDSVS